jgi:hypothetical protein
VKKKKFSPGKKKNLVLTLKEAIKIFDDYQSKEKVTDVLVDQ